jgi:hypothetical protein
MAKMGRPKSDNPKLHRFSVRVTDAEYEDILNYSELHGQSVTKTFLDGYALLRKEQSQENKTDQAD